MSDTTTDSSPELDANYDLILLNPAYVKLFRAGGDTLRATISDPAYGAERSFVKVAAARAFPLSRPNEYIGLRDGKDKDIGMLKTVQGMDAESLALLNAELFRRYFIPKIEQVTALKEEAGTFTFDVETDKGARRFIVQNLRESVQTIGPNRYLLTDKDGVRYEIPDANALTAPNAGRAAVKAFAVLQRAS